MQKVKKKKEAMKDEVVEEEKVLQKKVMKEAEDEKIPCVKGLKEQKARMHGDVLLFLGLESTLPSKQKEQLDREEAKKEERYEEPLVKLLQERWTSRHE